MVKLRKHPSRRGVGPYSRRNAPRLSDEAKLHLVRACSAYVDKLLRGTRPAD
jgi:hypothetical protein